MEAISLQMNISTLNSNCYRRKYRGNHLLEPLLSCEGVGDTDVAVSDIELIPIPIGFDANCSCCCSVCKFLLVNFIAILGAAIAGLSTDADETLFDCTCRGLPVMVADDVAIVIFGV